MGEKHGYQHLWKDAEATLKSTMQFTWLIGQRFYTITSNTGESDKVFFTQIGGTDPEFNLRNEHGLIIRKMGKEKTYVNILEPHGIFNPVREFTKDSKSSFNNVKIIYDDDNYTIVNLIGKNGIDWKLLISNKNKNENTTHRVQVSNENYEWVGPVSIQK